MDNEQKERLVMFIMFNEDSISQDNRFFIIKKTVLD